MMMVLWPEKGESSERPGPHRVEAPPIITPLSLIAPSTTFFALLVQIDTTIFWR